MCRRQPGKQSKTAPASRQDRSPAPRFTRLIHAVSSLAIASSDQFLTVPLTVYFIRTERSDAHREQTSSPDWR